MFTVQYDPCSSNNMFLNSTVIGHLRENSESLYLVQISQDIKYRISPLGQYNYAIIHVKRDQKFFNYKTLKDDEIFKLGDQQDEIERIKVLLETSVVLLEPLSSSEKLREILKNDGFC